MEVINVGMRKSIKTMCAVAQTAQFISLMPKPQDFVLRVIDDVVYLSSQVKVLSDEMNRLLDAYADVPVNYLMTQMNSITGSLTSIVNKVSDFSATMVDQTIGLAENTSQMVTDLTGAAIDTAGALTGAVVNLGSAVAQTPAYLLSQSDIAGTVNDGAEVIMEYVDGKFQNVKNDAVSEMEQVTRTLDDARTKSLDKINETTNKVNASIEKAYQYVEKLITKLREQMKKLEQVMDTGFKDVTGMSSISSGVDKVTEAISDMDQNPLTQAAGSITSTLSDVINNFNIGKVVFAFTGVMTQSLLVKTGLDELPPIDFEAMLNKVRDDIEMTPEELYAQYEAINSELTDAYNEFIEFGDESAKIPTEDRNYTSKNYKEFIKEYENDLTEQRNQIRTHMKYNAGDIDERNLKKELRSAIREARKYRSKVKNAKQAQKFKDILSDQLNTFKKNVETRCNGIKEDWDTMMKQYEKSVKNIKTFFSEGGSCSEFIDDCCDAINKDFDDIKELCKNLTTQLIGCTLKVSMPSDVGPVVPNPGYKIADFWMDIKTIFKFIKDLITLVMDIIANINKIARVMINGINNLGEIIKQLMDMLGLKWLMDLIQSIINLFGSNISDIKLRLENTLTPIYYRDTEEYNNTMDAIDDLLDGGNISKSQKAMINELFTMSGTNNTYSKLLSTYKKAENGNKEANEKLDEMFDNLEKGGDEIVAYKSPIIEESNSEQSVSDLANGESFDGDIKFIGWKFYHPDLSHTGSTYYSSNFMKKIKSKIIKKASKNGHKTKGGVTMLKTKKIGIGIGDNRPTAYNAFYWYTCYTEDLEKDCYDGMTKQDAIVIKGSMQTQNGSVVELSDGRKVFVGESNVRSGDYVVVEGVKYRVK